MGNEVLETRDRFPHFLSIPTRWIDNDVYGHVNNAVYFAYFDTAINDYLIREGGLDITGGGQIGVCVETMCRFRKEIGFPSSIDAGLRTAKLGNSSVRYELALFLAGEPEPAAEGYFVHVFIDRVTRRPTPMPAQIRAALERLVLPA